MPFEYLDLFPHNGIVTTPESVANDPKTASLILNLRMTRVGFLETREGVRMLLHRCIHNWDPDNWNSIVEKPLGGTLLTEYILSHTIDADIVDRIGNTTTYPASRVAYYPTGSVDEVYIYDVRQHATPTSQWRFKKFDRGLFYGMRKCRPMATPMEVNNFLTYYYLPLTTIDHEKREITIQFDATLGGDRTANHPETDAFAWSAAFDATWRSSRRIQLRSAPRMMDWIYRDWALDSGDRDEFNWIEHYQSATQYRNKLIISDRINGDLILYDRYDSIDQLQLPKKYELILQSNNNGRFDVNIVEVDFQLCSHERNGRGVESPMALYRFYLPKKPAIVSNDNVKQLRFTALGDVDFIDHCEKLDSDNVIIDSDVLCAGCQTFFYGFTISSRLGSKFWNGWANFWTVQRLGQYVFSNWNGSISEYADAFGIPTLKNPDVDDIHDKKVGVIEEKAADVYLWEDYRLTYYPCSGKVLGEKFLRYGDMFWNKTEPIIPKTINFRNPSGYEQQLRIGVWQYRFVWDYGDGQYSAPSAPLAIPELLWSAYRDDDLIDEIYGSYQRYIAYHGDGTEEDGPIKSIVAPMNLSRYARELLRLKRYLYDDSHAFGAWYESPLFIANSRVLIVSFLDSPDIICEGIFGESAHFDATEGLKIRAAHVHRLVVPAFKQSNYDWWKQEPLFTTYGRYRGAWRRPTTVPYVEFTTNDPSEIGVLKPEPFPIANLASCYIVPRSEYWKLFTCSTLSTTLIDGTWYCWPNEEDNPRQVPYKYNDRTHPITMFAEGGHFYINIAANEDDDWINDIERDAAIRRYTIYRATLKHTDRLTWFRREIPPEVVSRLIAEGFVELPVIPLGENVSFYVNKVEAIDDHGASGPYAREEHYNSLFIYGPPSSPYLMYRNNMVYMSKDFMALRSPYRGNGSTVLSPVNRATLLPLLGRLRIVWNHTGKRFVNFFDDIIEYPYLDACWPAEKRKARAELRYSRRLWGLGYTEFTNYILSGGGNLIYQDPSGTYNPVWNTWRSRKRDEYDPNYILDFVCNNLGVYVYLPSERLLFPEQFSAYFTSKMLFDAPRVLLRIRANKIPPRAKRLLIFRTRAIYDNAWQSQDFGFVESVEVKRDSNGNILDIEYFDTHRDALLDFGHRPDDYEALDRPLASRFNAVMNERVYYANFIERYLPMGYRGFVGIPQANCEESNAAMENLKHIVNIRFETRGWKKDTFPNHEQYNKQTLRDGFRSPEDNPIAVLAGLGDESKKYVRYFIVYRDKGGNVGTVEPEEMYDGWIKVLNSLSDSTLSSSVAEIFIDGSGFDVAENSHVVAAVGIEIMPWLPNTGYSSVEIYRSIGTIIDGQIVYGPFYKIGEVDELLPTVFVDNGLPNKEQWPWYRKTATGDIDYSAPYAPLIEENKTDYVRWSETYDPTTIRAESIEGVRAGDGDMITGMVPTYNGNLLIFKENSMVRWMTGGGFDVVRRDQVSDEYGCISPNGYTAFGEDIYFISRYGLMRYDDNRIYRADGPVAWEIQRLIKQYDTGILHPGVRDISMVIEPKGKLLYINIPIFDRSLRPQLPALTSWHEQYRYDAIEDLEDLYIRGHIYVLHLDSGAFTKYAYRTGLEGMDTLEHYALWERTLGRLYHVDTTGRLWSVSILPFVHRTDSPSDYSQYQQTPLWLETGHGHDEIWNHGIDDYIPIPRIGETVPVIDGSIVTRLPIVSIYATAVMRFHPTMAKRIRKFVVALSAEQSVPYEKNPEILLQGIYHDLNGFRQFAQQKEQLPMGGIDGELMFIPDFALRRTEFDRYRFVIVHHGHLIVRGAGLYWRPVHSYLG